jgi:hypothetical protein
MGNNPIFFEDNGGNTLEPGGNVTMAVNDVRSLVPKAYQSQIQVGKSGKIEFQNYDKLPDAVKKYEGVKLVNDLINSSNHYQYNVDNKSNARVRGTGDAGVVEMKFEGKAVNGIMNLSKTPRTDVPDGDYLPEAGFDGTVTVDDGEFTREILKLQQLHFLIQGIAWCSMSC